MDNNKDQIIHDLKKEVEKTKEELEVVKNHLKQYGVDVELLVKKGEIKQPSLVL